MPEATPKLKDILCPECETPGYLIFPSFKDCQTCLKLRTEAIEAWAERLKKDPT